MLTLLPILSCSFLTVQQFIFGQSLSFEHFFFLTVKHQACILRLDWGTIPNGNQGEEKQLCISYTNIRNEQARDRMVGRKATEDHSGFLENYFLNYSLNILDLGRVTGDTLWKTKTMHRENNHINRSHFLLFILTVSFFLSLKF